MLLYNILREGEGVSQTVTFTDSQLYLRQSTKVCKMRDSSMANQRQLIHIL